MSIRSLWIISPTSSNNWQMNFLRSFATVERKARILHGSDYVAFPLQDRNFIVHSILNQTGLQVNTSQRISQEDSCCIVKRMPIISMPTKENKKMWPIVVVEHCGNLLCSLPLLEEHKNEEDISSLVEIGSVSTAFSVLFEIQKYLGPMVKLEEKHILMLNNYLSKTMPFGRPSEMDSNAAREALQNKCLTLSLQHKQPSLKPLSVPKTNCIITVSECIRCNQYDNHLQGLIDIYGTVTWRGSLENIRTDVTITLTSQGSSTLESVAVHPCVSHIDSDSVQLTSKKLRFIPVAPSLVLCYYTVLAKHGNFPIQGNYSMKYDMHGQFCVNLKFSENIKNSFEYLDITISFSDKPTEKLTLLNLKPSWGMVSFLDNKNKLSWTLGQKLPSKLETSLEGSFSTMQPFASMEDKNNFISRSYVSISFRIPSYTFSGFDVNAKSIQTLPPTKAKISCEKEFCSMEYILWNCFGNPPLGFH